ncbi:MULTISPECIES: hypothetical protein [Alicyclobacillus]|uniref:Uncharacterized protein n=1 Tax=Alicyclobacillus acidoterrestris (strain ATCC 49025 / DSM 3922 / CIP 106132 / NCIMB 13137 / GD3B) TaxID=1356854 RepID=T0CV68_ALIAG|nr:MULTISPECIES: hypothetical protein [Alicyclobacillus]EPZ41421.1 hypothetical protein N007_17035 [Alicyclobacillus acidoterrestris ATCC 49025]UNO47762.1 hypothetical protein K1I37_13825 [Alicyclobacillus acidoterrestris]GEO27592.1 hypothetical protein AAC03nite_33770 [Alicyclobacillus acidoterrestris]
MKKWIPSLATALTVLAVSSPVALAATTNKPTTGTLVLNNDTIASPNLISKGGQTYTPAWYVMQVLKSAGIQSTWKGNTWAITSTGSQVVAKKVANIPDNQVAVVIDGNSALKLPKLVAVDPASHQRTTYLRLTDLTTVLQKLGLQVDNDGSSLQVQTPLVHTLETAMENAQAAPNSQLTGTMTEHIQFNLTPQGQTDLQGALSSLDMSMNMTAQTGTVNGEKATYISIQPTLSSDGDNSSTIPLPGDTNSSSGSLPTIQEYIQGTKVWVNEGQGWQEETSAEQTLTELESELPTNDVDFTALRNIQATKSGDTTTYTATLDNTAIQQMLSPIMDAITAEASSGTDDSGITPDQLGQLIDTVLKNMKETVQFTVQPVNGEDQLTAENMTLDMNLPTKSIPSTDPTDDITKDVTSISLHETMKVSYTYQDVTITPPADLPTDGAQ